MSGDADHADPFFSTFWLLGTARPYAGKFIYSRFLPSPTHPTISTVPKSARCPYITNLEIVDQIRAPLNTRHDDGVGTRERNIPIAFRTVVRTTGTQSFPVILQSVDKGTESEAFFLTRIHYGVMYAHMESPMYVDHILLAEKPVEGNLGFALTY